MRERGVATVGGWSLSRLWRTTALPGGLAVRWLPPSILALLFLLGIFVAVESYRSIDRELTAAATARRSSLAYLAATTLTEKLDRMVDLGVSLATRVRFRELVTQARWKDAVKIMDDVPKDFPAIDHIFLSDVKGIQMADVPKDFSAIDRIFLSDVKGIQMADVPEVPAMHGQDLSGHDWYKGVTAEWKPYVSIIFKRVATPQINIIAIAIPITSEAGENVGILVLQVRIESFFAWLGAVDFGPKGHLYVVDRFGTVAFHPAVSPEGATAHCADSPLVQKVLAGQRGVEVSKDPVSDINNLVAYEPMPKYGWGVVAQQPLAEAFAARDAQLRRVAISYGLIALVSLVAWYFGLKVLDQRRRAVTNAAAKIELERLVAERTEDLRSINEELEGFSYSVSHDLRTPLRAIDCSAAILESEHRDILSSAGHQRLRTIRKNTQRMGQLIDDLLTFARLGRVSLSAGKVDMAALVQDVINELRASGVGAEKVEIEVKTTLPPARGDAALLRQVWMNLLTNALKFGATAEQPRIEIGGDLVDGECRYYVCDNGAGFNMKYYGKLFGVFQRLHGTDEFPGTGVGLAFAKRIIVRHGGNISAESAIGAGATFRFSLPRADG